MIAECAVVNDLIVISDEVWEHILLDGQRFTPIASLAGMEKRTLKCGSAGKIFSLTGWKIGWLAASAELATLAARAHQFLTFASAPNLQSAVAYGLNDGDAWLQPMRERFARARDRMSAGLEAAGYAVLPSASTYFLCVDLAASGIALDDESLRPTGGRTGRRGGRAAVALRRTGSAAPPDPTVLRQARRNHRCRRRGAGQGQEFDDMTRSTADEARDLLGQLGAACGGSLASYSPIDGQVIGSVAEASAAECAGGLPNGPSRHFSRGAPSLRRGAASWSG